jgi:hypothetical protein
MRTRSPPVSLAKRSSAKAGMRNAGRVGSLVCRDLVSGEEIRISAGKMSAEERVEYWKCPKLLLGKVCNYKAFGYGLKEKLRFPTFQYIREDV